MPESPRDPEALLRRLEWTVIRRLDGLLHGDYRSLFRGFGIDLADIREYQFHDDVRHIDWNVTARMQTPYVRQYNEDREITAWFLLDFSPSVDFGSETKRKREVTTEFVGLMARLFSRQGNRVGAIFYGDGIDMVIPARSGRRHVLHMMNTTLNRPELQKTSGTDLRDFLRSAFQIIQRRSLVFVVSDFISAPGWEEPLSQLSQRHETLAVRLFDPLEMNLPNLGMFVMQDAETGEQVFVDTNDRGFRKRFTRIAEKREAELRTAFGKAGVDALELSTEDDLTDTIMRFADLRRQRSRASGGGTVPNHLEAAR